MRVLYLTTEFPFPPTSGGRVRSLAELELLVSLPEVTSLTVLTLREADISRADILGLTDRLKGARVLESVFHPIHLKQFPHYFAWVAALRVARRLPYLAGKWVSPRVYRRIRRILSQTEFDVVYIDHLGMAVYLPLVRRLAPRARFVLEQHNVESDFFAQYAERQTNPVKRAVARSEHETARRWEIATMKKVDAVVAISTSDADAFRAMAGVDAHVVPQVMPLSRRPWTSGRKKRLVYLGNLTWHPNVEGLDWFVQEVWPHVRANAPDAVLDIGGSGLPPGTVPEKWRAAGVNVVGFVADLEVFYEGAVGFLAPILGGSGVRIKVLEAFRAGLPLVTTDAGALGLPIQHGEHALIGNDARAYADNVVRLCGDDDLQVRLREGGYDYIEEHHSQRAAAKVMRLALGF